MLHICNVSASVLEEEQSILHRFSLTIREGEIHVLMGPNGAGKSTLAKVLAGHPSYKVLSGEISFLGENLLNLEPEERAKLGLFMGFQYPVEIPGVTNFEFLYAAYLACLPRKEHEGISRTAFREFVLQKMEELNISASFLDRDVNSGFSGGEKKRNEILQLAVLSPKLAILDETDSGLDIDAMRIVADGVKRHIGKKQGLLLITHYHRLLEYIRPDFVHIVVAGQIVRSGGIELALMLEEKGYDSLLSSKVEV